METNGKHIINRLKYHVLGVPVDKAFLIKEEAATYIKGPLSNRMQLLFDKYFPGRENIQIDKIELSVNFARGEIDLQQYEKQLLELLEKQLQKNAPKKSSAKFIKKEGRVTEESIPVSQITNTTNYNAADAFIFFLKKGYLPWWFKIATQQEFEKQLIGIIEVADQRMLALLLRQPTMRDSKSIHRFVQQFSNDFKIKLAACYFAEDFVSIEKIHRVFIELIAGSFTRPSKKIKSSLSSKANIHMLHSVKSKAESIFWNIFLSAVDKEHSFSQFENEIKISEREILELATDPVLESSALRNLLKEIGKQHYKPDAVQTDHENKNMIQPDEEIFINNAGLVLFHPFIVTLFNAMGITDEEHIIDSAKAVATLNYLCGYEDIQPEFEWPLIKVLCGLEVSDSVEYLAVLSDAEKLECNAMLQQVVDYWVALKQTSIEGLQQTFVQRFGKLSVNENGWLLQVEQKTVDILKDRLPWGVSMVKLPWMKQLLTVEW